MKRPLALLAIVCLVPFTAADWLHFRGTHTNSVATGPPPPLEWDAETNVAWKNPLPGRGVCGPIVVQGKVIVTCSSGYRRDRLHVLCFDAAGGEPQWQRQFWATGRTLCHPTSAVAANTPASDGKNIYAFFSCNDLICLDLDGNLKWMRGLTLESPTAANDVGMSSSPVVVNGTVIVQVENPGDSFVAGVDAASGKTLWKLPRPQAFNWSSPTVLPGKSRQDDLVVVQCGKHVTALIPKSGKAVWEIEAACSNIPSAATDGDRLFVPAEDGLLALGPQKDDGSPRLLLWRENRLNPSSPSPVASGGKVYAVKGSVLVCGDAKSGETLWQLRLKGRRFWATPVLMGKYLLAINADGLAQVVDVSGEKGKVAAQNDFGEPVLGSPAVVDGAVFVRGEKHLWKISKP